MAIVNLSTFACGQLQEKFDMAFMQVLSNMQDVNTPYKNKRGITMKVTFEQNEARDDVVVNVSVDTKLASVAPAKTHMSTAKDIDTGNVYFEEYGSQCKGQMTIEEVQVCNNETVVDFRKVKES